MSIKQKWLRHKVKKRLSKREITSPDPIEQKGVDIFLTLLKEQDSQLVNAPLSSERLVENSKREMLVILEHGKMTIINSVYQYEIKIAEKTEDQLRVQFNEVQEKRAQSIKRRSGVKVKKSLDTIIEELNQNKDE
jgi:PHD/YefM family antitoxin component YafN of YafNO toxin-antitoxin module